MKYLFTILGSLTLSLAPLVADVTITSKIDMPGGMGSGPSVMYIKGQKMRVEHGALANSMVMIIDAGTRQMISLHLSQHTADIYDLAKLGETVAKKISTDDIKVSVTPNSQTKTILGKACVGYNIAMTVPMTMGTMTMTMEMAGQNWIAKGVPGTADITAFWKTSAQNGIFFGDPQQLKTAPAQAKGMTEMFKALSELGGISYGSTMQMKMSGTGPMAEVMSQRGGMTINTEVTAITTTPIADSMFQIPADFTTMQK